MSTATKHRLISADDHVDLSHDRVKSFLATKHHGEYDDALMTFAASMQPMRSVDANQRWREQQGLDPDEPISGMGENRAHPAFGRAGHTDPIERLKDMDTDGVEASSSYCEVSAFRYLYMLETAAAEATRAFNTALGEFASADPQRLVVSYQIPIHDIDAAVAEVTWAAEHGCRSLQLPVFPAELGLPDYWDGRYDPLWAAIQDADLPICCHIGLNTRLEDLARRDPTPQKGIFVPMVGLSSGEALGMWVLTGVFERFPRLKVVFVEPGLGWVSWWVYIADDMAARQGYEFPGLTRLPSEYFRQNVYLTFIDEPDAMKHARDRLGIENIMWSSDYPHPVSSWPRSQALVEEMFRDASEDERELVLAGNAARVWNL
jgi:predicted TIM-barrel fold metal-dependent hydrolase